MLEKAVDNGEEKNLIEDYGRSLQAPLRLSCTAVIISSYFFSFNNSCSKIKNIFCKKLN